MRFGQGLQRARLDRRPQLRIDYRMGVGDLRQLRNYATELVASLRT